ncbi:response regulator [Thiomicrospira sp. S5]|uniref:response regulator n=1 Tax=Thiomicrospira sp. S5 TaxID=1803865 RepID=UPI000F8A1592|nr:response regulator [Thiomicrospira sp. S5]AZR82850.1 hypothetical protein AYJ59_11520 [Thiomicrospira sp. S5]
MNILVVEDDCFKYTRIEKLIRNEKPSSFIDFFGNAREAVLFIKKNNPDKIILDMSLPSHPQKKGEGSGLPLPKGGMEVILTLRRIGKYSIPIAILTQYEDIEINDEYYSVADAKEIIVERYGIKNLTVALYDNDSSDWEVIIKEFLSK